MRDRAMGEALKAAACSRAEGGDCSREEEGGEFEDRRWRRIRLVPHSSGWEERCRSISQQLASSACSPGLVLLPDAG